MNNEYLRPYGIFSRFIDKDLFPNTKPVRNVPQFARKKEQGWKYEKTSNSMD